MRFSAACLVLLAVTGAVGCTKEGPARSAASDEERLVLRGRDGDVGLRLTITPARPHAGDKVSWVADMTVGEPPYARGGFTYNILIDSLGGESLMDSCGAPLSPDPRPRAGPKSRRQVLRKTYTFLEAGPHDFSMSASPGCEHELGNPGVEGTIDVLPARPENTHRWTGSNDRWSVDVTALPRRPVALLDRVGFDLAIEREDDEPISWKISYGDGHDKVGGHACEPDARGANDDRFERHYVHHYNRPAEFHVTIEVSNDCLRSARGTKVIDETLYVRPRPLRYENAFYLPSHRSDDVPAGSLGDVDVVGDRSSRCVWLQRADGSRIAALWPAGFYARFDPLRVYNDKQAEVFRQGRPRDAGGVYGAVHADRVPEECRVGDRTFWVDRLRGY